MNRSNVDQLQEQMDELIEKLTFKGKATQLREMAIEAMKEALDQHQAKVSNLQNEITQHENENKDLKQKVFNQNWRIERLEEKLQIIIKKANFQCKNATGRGNRFKKQYERLLDNIDAVLPGSKELLVKKGSSEHERQKRLIKLDRIIKHQHQKVKGLTDYHRRYGETKLAGYGREHRILRAMIARKQKEEKRPTYIEE